MIEALKTVVALTYVLALLFAILMIFALCGAIVLGLGPSVRQLELGVLSGGLLLGVGLVNYINQKAKKP
jgi:predicted membrane protein